MDNSKHFHRKKIKFRSILHEKKITIFSLLVICYLSLHIDEKQVSTINSDSSQIFSHGGVYMNRMNVTECTNPNEPQPRLPVLIDDKINKELAENNNNGMTNETLSNFPHHGICSHISPTLHILCYANKSKDNPQNVPKILLSKYFDLKSLAEYKLKSETNNDDFLFENRLPENVYKNNNSRETDNFAIEFDAYNNETLIDSNYSLFSFENFHVQNYNCLNDYHNISKLEEYHSHRRQQTNKYIRKPIGNGTIGGQILSIFDELFDDFINIMIECEELWSHNRDRTHAKAWADRYEYRSYTDHSTLDYVKLNSAKSPGYMIHPSKLVILISIIMTISATTSSAESAEVPSTPIVTDENSNELPDKIYLLKKHLQCIKAEIPSCKFNCKNWGTIKVLDSLTGNNRLHDIKHLFTEVIVERSNIFFKRKMPIKCKDIFNMVSESSILLLDSETGKGKSAIIQYGVNDWGVGGQEWNLTGFNFIFPMTFQNPHLCSVADLIGGLIPNVRTYMDNEDIMRCVADPSLNILFVCDGYDHKNDKSNKLFQEIVNLKEKHTHIKLIVTSRPESVQELYDTSSSNLDIDHLQVRGIHESMRSNFLKKYHDELVRVGMSQQSTVDLLQFFESCSDKHKELYHLQINLIVLSWLWGQDPKIVKTINSAAGLYTVILDLLNEKLIKSIVKFHPDTMTKINNDKRELTNLINCFMVMFYNASLVALRDDCIFIDKAEIKKLLDVCRDKGLPHVELLNKFLLSRFEWEIELEESLEIPHNDLRDFYAAKSIESKITHDNLLSSIGKVFFSWHWANKLFKKLKGNRVKNILLEHYDNDHSKYESNKYQNVLIFLGEILALKDDRLVEEHGEDIIELLIESGINTNTLWYTVYSKFAINPKAAEKFANFIAPHLDLNIFTIKDADVEVLSTLLQYVNVDTVTFDISSTAIQPQLSILIEVLKRKQCCIKISNIEDEQVDLWNSIIKPYDKMEILKVTLKAEYASLPLHTNHNAINEYHLQSYWRELQGAAPNMVKCEVRRLWTSINNTDALPVSVTHLYLGLLVDPTTGVTQDPGLTQLTHRCPQLEYLGVHVKVETLTEQLPHLPDLGKYNSRTSLYLPHLSDYEHVQWAVDTAKKLQPTRGYCNLFFPRCGLWVDQLCELMKKLATDGVVVNNVVAVSSGHSYQETEQLKVATHNALHCGLIWYQNDARLSYEWYW